MGGESGEARDRVLACQFELDALVEDFESRVAAAVDGIGCEQVWGRGQSALNGGPSSDMPCFSKSAATTARSGAPLRAAGPSSW